MFSARDDTTFGLSDELRQGRILVYGPILMPMDETLKKHVIHCLPVSGNALPFPDFTFDVALCAHYLLTDAFAFDVEAQVHGIKELARVAKDVRIFPLGGEGGCPSSLLGPVLLRLNQDNYGVEVRNEASAGGAMLHVWAQQCLV
jgi:hypothetical protein